MGPNQHSAVKYSPNRQAAATTGSSARTKAAHRGAARKLPEIVNYGMMKIKMNVKHQFRWRKPYSGISFPPRREGGRDMKRGEEKRREGTHLQQVPKL